MASGQASKCSRPWCGATFKAGAGGQQVAATVSGGGAVSQGGGRLRLLLFTWD